MPYLQGSQLLDFCKIIFLFSLDTQERRPISVVDHLCTVDGIPRSQMQAVTSTTKPVNVDAGIYIRAISRISQPSITCQKQLYCLRRNNPRRFHPSPDLKAPLSAHPSCRPSRENCQHILTCPSLSPPKTLSNCQDCPSPTQIPQTCWDKDCRPSATRYHP